MLHTIHILTYNIDFNMFISINIITNDFMFFRLLFTKQLRDNKRYLMHFLRTIECDPKHFMRSIATSN